MKVKELIEKLNEIDPELEITTCVDENAIGDYSLTYGIEPSFSVETLYEYNDEIYLDADELIDAIAENNDLDDLAEINKIFDCVDKTTKLVIKVSP